MAPATARKSKVYTISLPPELAQRAEALAQRDSRTMSELFREAFRTYSAQQARRTLNELGDYAEGCNPKGFSEVDVPRLIKDVRAEKPRRRRVRSNG
jgi:predicted DNA-binding protein